MKFKEFIRDNTKIKIVERDNKLKLAKESRSDADWTSYKIARNEVCKMIKIDKKYTKPSSIKK